MPGARPDPAAQALSALGDPQRRSIVELLAERERSVREIADALPISRPAVSRHLRLLKDAGLVAEEPRGTRRIYRLRADGAAAVRAYLEQLWGQAAQRFRLLAENTPRTPTVVGRNDGEEEGVSEPLRLSFEVACPSEHAFQVWTRRIGAWWPADHTATGETGLEIVLEPRVGGRIYQRDTRGMEIDWGEVTLWEPPARLGYLWHLRRDRADATDVVITFVPLGRGATRVDVVHTGWERLGADADRWRDANRSGWTTLMPHFLVAAGTEDRTGR